jgi:hypothetical protein
MTVDNAGLKPHRTKPGTPIGRPSTSISRRDFNGGALTGSFVRLADEARYEKP